MERDAINVELLQRTLAFIKKNQSKWHQGWWRILRKKEQGAIKCQTSMCFAGWAAVLDNPKLEWAEPVNWAGDTEHRASLVVADEDDQAWVERTHEHDYEVSLADPEAYYLVGGIETVPAMSVAYRAQRILGLNKEERCELFAGSNDLDDLERIVARLTEEQTQRDNLLLIQDSGKRLMEQEVRG